MEIQIYDPDNTKFKMPYDSWLMCQTALKLPCRSVQTGSFRNDLVPILRPHVISMTQKHNCGHWDFNKRVSQISQIIGGSLMEVVAMGGPLNNPKEGAGKQFSLWRNSAGHWKAINSICKYYCYCLGVNNDTYYGMGIIIK